MNTYYYHRDHLGSSQLVSDYQGKEYERVEYTPYGESWMEKESDSRELLPFKFTGKELDSETGLYYYGARYLNPRTSRWVSADPALGDYLPKAPVNDQARQGNRNLPGFGGVFNPINLAMYQYAANNPVKYKDPTGLRTGPDDFDTVYYPPPQRQTEITSVTTNSSFYKNSTEYNVSQVASGVRYNETMQKVQVHTNTTTFTSETTLGPKNQRYAQGQSNGPSLSVEVTFTVSTKTSEGLCKVHIATREKRHRRGWCWFPNIPFRKAKPIPGSRFKLTSQSRRPVRAMNRTCLLMRVSNWGHKISRRQIMRELLSFATFVGMLLSLGLCTSDARPVVINESTRYFRSGLDIRRADFESDKQRQV